MSTAQEITPELVAERLRRLLAELLEMEPSELDPEVPLSAFGIDSMTASVLVDDLQKWCGARLRVGDLLSRLTLAEAAEEIVAELRSRPEGR